MVKNGQFVFVITIIPLMKPLQQKSDIAVLEIPHNSSPSIANPNAVKG